VDKAVHISMLIVNFLHICSISLCGELKLENMDTVNCILFDQSAYKIFHKLIFRL